VFNYDKEVIESAKYPNLRLYEINHNSQNASVIDAAVTGPYRWAITSPDTIGPKAGATFSALCYLHGKYLLDRDAKVPIGLIHSSFGGTSDLRWSSPAALAKCGLKPQADWTTLWYGMVTPFLKLRMAGAIWYQGESDAGNPQLYMCTFPEMIKDWRVNFNLPNLPFGFVQLATCKDIDFSIQRIAQTVALQLPNVVMAVAYDLGDPTSPWGDIHPRDKAEVARRMTLSMSAIMYGSKDVFVGPIPTKFELVNEKWVVITLAFEQGLVRKGAEACVQCCNEDPFEYYIDGKWVRVQSAISSANQIIVGGPKTPQLVRFAFGTYPQCSYYNSANIPMGPFAWDPKKPDVVATL